MKKLLALVLVCGLALTGCSSNDDGGDTGETVVVQVGVEKNYVPYFEEIATDFESANEGVDIQIVETAMFDILDNLEAQKGNSADVFMLPNDRIGDLAEKKLIIPTTADLSGYTETAQVAATYGDDQYFVPMSTDTTLLFFNKELVDSAPATLKELDPAVWSAKYTDFYVAAGMFYSNGGYIFGADNTDVGLNNEGSVKAGEAIQGLYASKAMHWEALKEEQAGYELQVQSFLDGDISYVVDGPWKVTDFVNGGIAEENLGFAPIPSWDGSNEYRPLAGTKGMTVNAYSDVQEVASEFVAFLASDEYASKWFEMTNEVNPHTSIQYEEGSLASVVLEATSQGTPMPTDPAFGKVWVPMADALKQIANGGDVKASLDAAVETINAEIAAMQ